MSLVPTLEISVSSCNNWNSISPYVTKLTINEGVCNDVTSAFSISGFIYLKSLVVKKNSMKNLNSLTIENNLRLERIVTEDSNSCCSTGAFNYVNSVIIRSLIDLIQLIRSSSINNIHYRRGFILSHNIIEFDWFDWFDSTHSIFLN